MCGIPRSDGCSDAVTVLRVFQENFMEGKPLDLSSSADDIDGATWPIFVSRLNVFESGLAELMTEGASYCIPLEVTW